MSTTKLLVWWTLVWPFGTIRMRNIAQVFINIVLEPTLHTTDCSLSQQYEKTSSCWWRLRGIFSKHFSKLTFSHWTSTYNYQPYNPTTWLSAFPILVYPGRVGLNSIDIFFSPNKTLGNGRVHVCPSFSFPPRALVWFFRFFFEFLEFFPQRTSRNISRKNILLKPSGVGSWIVLSLGSIDGSGWRGLLVTGVFKTYLGQAGQSDQSFWGWRRCSRKHMEKQHLNFYCMVRNAWVRGLSLKVHSAGHCVFFKRFFG